MTNFSGIVEVLRKERDRLSKEIQAVNAALTAFGAVYKNGTGTRPPLSAAARARIAAAQRTRWAKSRTANGHKNVVAAPKKVVVSAATRKKIAAAQRARWARVRAQK